MAYSYSGDLKSAVPCECTSRFLALAVCSSVVSLLFMGTSRTTDNGQLTHLARETDTDHVSVRHAYYWLPPKPLLFFTLSNLGLLILVDELKTPFLSLCHSLGENSFCLWLQCPSDQFHTHSCRQRPSETGQIQSWLLALGASSEGSSRYSEIYRRRNLQVQIN